MPSRAVSPSNPCWNDTPRKTREHSFCSFELGRLIDFDDALEVTVRIKSWCRWPDSNSYVKTLTKLCL